MWTIVSKILREYEYYYSNEEVGITFIKKIVDVYFQKHADSTVMDLKRDNEELYDIVCRMYGRYEDFFEMSLIYY